MNTHYRAFPGIPVPTSNLCCACGRGFEAQAEDAEQDSEAATLKPFLFLRQGRAPPLCGCRSKLRISANACGCRVEQSRACSPNSHNCGIWTRQPSSAAGQRVNRGRSDRGAHGHSVRNAQTLTKLRPTPTLPTPHPNASSLVGPSHFSLRHRHRHRRIRTDDEYPVAHIRPSYPTSRTSKDNALIPLHTPV
jgi:hypothetical protein